MITLADICEKVSIPLSAIGDIPLNIPITVLQQCNNTNQQTHFATRVNGSAHLLPTWIWSMHCTFVSTDNAIIGTKYFVEWNGEIYVFDMNSDPVKELVFNAIFYDDYHKSQ
jgi:hypothetical protein